MPDELVSVILPTYNRADMLSRSVRSVLDQEYPHIELIIVDDASTDHTKDVVASFEDKRIKYILLSKNSGGAATPRNQGMKIATGAHIAFLDSDDEFLEGRLSKLLKQLKKLDSSTALIFSNCVMNDSDSTLFATKDIRSGFVGVENKFPASVFCPPSCWLLNKSLVDSEYFDEEIHVIEDCDYFARIVRKYPAYFLNEPLVKKYTHTNLAGGVPIEFSENTRERMLSKWLTEMKKDKKYLVDFYCTMSKDLMRLGNKKKSLKALIKALKIDIFNPKIIGKVFKVIFS